MILDGAERRKKRLRKIEEFIDRANGIPIGTLVSNLQYHIGLSEPRVREYLEILRKCKRIYTKGMKIYVRKER